MRLSRVGWAVLAMTAVGLILRLVGLGDIPLGLHHDEGYNALDALAILDGWRPVFLPGNFGREPLFIYLIAASIQVFGATPWAIRLPGALAGALIIPAQYLLVSSLPLPRPRLTGLLSAALLAVTFWPIAKGHQGLRAGLLPLWVTLALWAWWRAMHIKDFESTANNGCHPERSEGSHPTKARCFVPQHDKVCSCGTPTTAWYGILRVTAYREGFIFSLVTGVFLAAGLYTHTNGRLLPLILLAVAGWEVVSGRGRRAITALLIALAVAGVLALPLGLYFLDQPDLFTQRAGQVSILNPDINQGQPVAALLDNATKLALMPIVRGTESGWENLVGRPVFDPLLGIAFVVGLLVLVRDLLGRRGAETQRAAVLLGLAYLVMLVPSWLSDAAPHYGRLTGIWPVLFLLPAWGLERGLAWLEAQKCERLAYLGVSIVIGISAVWSGWDFFGRYAVTPEIRDVYRGGAIERGEQVAALVAQGPTYVSPAVWSQTPIRMVNYRQPPASFDPRHGLVLPPEGDARYVFEMWEAKDADVFQRRWTGLERQAVVGVRGEPILLAYRLPQAKRPTLANRLPPDLDTTFGDQLRLAGLDVDTSAARPGGTLDMTLEWLTLQPTAIDHNFFVHLVAGDGRMVGQADGAPLGGSYPTHVWRPGEQVLYRVTVPIARDAPRGEATLRIGWYNWRDGVRLPLPGGRDNALEVKGVPIG